MNIKVDFKALLIYGFMVSLKFLIFIMINIVNKVHDFYYIVVKNVVS